MSKYEKMLECNRKSSSEKIELAKKAIFEMLDDGEKITIPKLIAKTGLSIGFFYKNQIVRTVLDKALEQQVGMTDPRKHILDMAMGNEIERLHEKIRTLQSENRSLQEENEKLQRALSRKKSSIIRSL